MTAIPRHLYIGVVALLCRIYNTLDNKQRAHYEGDGDPMARVARDFSAAAAPARMLAERGRYTIVYDAPEETPCEP